MLNNEFNKTIKNGVVNNNPSRKDKLDYFCEILENSDVSVIGITDYFDYKSSKETIDYFNKKYPDSQKTLLYNIELRLDLSVHKSGSYINIHLLFSEEISTIQIENFICSTEITSSYADEVQKLSSVRDMKLKDHEDKYDTDALDSVMISFDKLIHQLESNFGKNYNDKVILIASGRNDGLSQGSIRDKSKFNKPRSNALIDRIDKKCNAIFARGKDAEYWLKNSRYEPKSRSLPTFGGCDAHSFDSLKEMLGNSGENEKRAWETTWIKADPSFKGLLQTLIEPENRVKIQAHEPDFKEDFHVIDKIIFNDNEFTSDSPIYLNQNLNSVIGSRSSGKSALLTYISYAIDKDSTIKALQDTGLQSAGEGPAAGISWDDAERNNYIPQVIWKDPELDSEKVIFVPQNSLFALSNRQKEITDKIKNLIRTKNQDLFYSLETSERKIHSDSQKIEKLVDEWFEIELEIKELLNTENIPFDKDALKRAWDRTQQDLDSARGNSQLTEDEISSIKSYKDKKEHLNASAEEQRTFAKKTDYLLQKDLNVYLKISLTSAVDSTEYYSQLPEPISNKIDEILKRLENNFTTFVNKYLNSFKTDTEKLIDDLDAEIDSLDKEFGELDSKYNESSRVEELESKLKDYSCAIKEIEEKENQIKELRAVKSSKIDSISSLRGEIENYYNEIIDIFDKSEKIEDIDFFAEVGDNSSKISTIIEFINKQRNNYYYDKIGELFEFSKVSDDIEVFLESCFDPSSEKTYFKETKKNNRDRLDFAKKVLSYTKDISLGAIYADDKIGGFGKSTMTPGKQSLFALTLILASSDQKWPLLIDQPEDDLDSRSIYETIVPYLKERKKERQIIMVTHNANMAIGSDSEQIIVVNRHSSDARNKDNKFFQYKNGALEDSLTNNKSEIYLDKFGIKEHCCLLLDGGEEAFENRKLKYSI